MNNRYILSLFLLLFLSVMAGTACAQSPFDTTMFGRNKAVGRFLKTRGFNMYYETYGTGQPLVIIHGNGGSISDFMYQIPYFAKNYKVIVADSRAQGQSADPGDSLSYEMMADDLNALLDTLHADSSFVIGWSDGGIDGLLLAMRHPEKVKKLAVTGANLWPDTTAVDPFIYRWAARLNDSLRRTAQTPQARQVYKVTRLMTFEPHITTRQLALVRCPTLVIGGDHDALLPRHTLLIAESIPNSYLWILPNSGHSTPINYKDQFNTVVGDFFSHPYRKIEGMNKLN